jgi:hypothetical protein
MARVRDLAKREQWKGRLAEFERGELTVADFCRRLGVSTAAFYRWKRELGQQRAGSAPAPGKQGADAQFIPIGISVQPSIEVQLIGGARIFVPCHEHGAIHVVLDALTSPSAEDRSC